MLGQALHGLIGGKVEFGLGVFGFGFGSDLGFGTHVKFGLVMMMTTVVVEFRLGCFVLISTKTTDYL